MTEKTGAALMRLFSVLSGGFTFEPYTLSARRAVAKSIAAAQQRGHAAIETEDLLLGLILADPELLERVRTHVGFASDAIEMAIDRVAPLRPGGGEPEAGLPLSPQLKDVLDRAAADAADRVTTKELLLALLHCPGVAAQVLREVGVSESVVSSVAESNQDA